MVNMAVAHMEKCGKHPTLAADSYSLLMQILGSSGSNASNSVSATHMAGLA